MLDGDSIEATLPSGETIEVRLVGVNAPESGECHFGRASEYLIGRVLGREIELQALGTDRFGRTLALVTVETTRVNAELVARGHAIALTPEQDDPPGTDLRSAESEAMNMKAGLWADHACGAETPIPRVQITDVDPDPGGLDEEHLEDERIVISNEGGTDVEIGGWVLRDESSLHRHRFKPGTLLPAGAALTITSASPSWQPGGGPVWNNDGDLALLMDESGRVVDALRY